MRLVLKLDDQLLQEYVFNKKDVTFGRTSENDVYIVNESVSARHATLHQTESGNTILADMNSTNGVFVNDQKVSRHKMNDGDSIGIGQHRIIFYSDNDSAIESPKQQSEATVIMSADFQQQLQAELNKPKAATVITRHPEKSWWGKIKQLFGF